MIQLRVSGLRSSLKQVVDDVEQAENDYFDTLKTILQRSDSKSRPAKAGSGETPYKTGKAARGWKRTPQGVRNTVEYINRLDKGWSNQAPSGFTKQAIRRTDRIVQRKIK